MIEKWKESVDNGGAFGALMTDLYKAFACLHHEILIGKSDAYGFDIRTVKLIQQYLSNRKQRIKIGNAYMERNFFMEFHIINIFLCEFFYFQ